MIDKYLYASSIPYPLIPAKCSDAHELMNQETDILFQQAKQFFKELQQQMCGELLSLESEKLGSTSQDFTRDEWKSTLGQGSTNILENGKLWEKAGVAFSEISSAKLPTAASARHENLANKPYKACGISIVIHPRNPYVPTSHANLRMFVIDDDGESISDDESISGEKKNWWFGGGFDLTPYYIEKSDCDIWHQAAKNLCDKYEA
ncbi:MAG: coproporphyrinogen III oxidase, partial [Candidatus Portiera sp.]|nr:coproporphyrinogen III oxidase [Portiera sp.]